MNEETDWARELRHSWPLLQGANPSEISTSTLGVTVGDVDVRIGIDGRNVRHMLVPIVDDDEPTTDEREATVSVSRRTYTFARRPWPYLDIVCKRSDLFDLFDEVLVDVLVSIAVGPENAASTAASVVSRWRALFAAGPRLLLTVQAQMSLIGELYVLDLVSSRTPLDVTTWRGPLREPHDIVLSSCALEVKAVGTTSKSIEVHGLHQLEPPGAPLGLVIVRVLEASDGNSLAHYVNQMLDRVADRGEALRRLAAVGYSIADAERYSQRFAVEDLAFVEVSGALPRVVPASFSAGNVPEGIERISYEILLDVLDPLLTRSETSLNEWVERWAA